MIKDDIQRFRTICFFNLRTLETLIKFHCRQDKKHHPKKITKLMKIVQILGDSIRYTHDIKLSKELLYKANNKLSKMMDKEVKKVIKRGTN